ncbi:xylosyltransferase oxt [Drosophila sulfurigaster albostrigata]|uniref:xylosyltransferase oxt n=1 Tax=Drosophila sulfurigaster albostrigata TaxID=89887 RepID=UPI002D21E2F5|nr:xylosyltransferase oxt [Drosophila sulfurigaster albostrigata]
MVSMEQQSSPSMRWLRRYRSFFIILLFIIAIQLFLAYKSRDIDLAGALRTQRDIHESTPESSPAVPPAAPANVVPVAKQLGFQPECDINAKEAISALQRAKTKDCRQHIAHIACAIQAGRFYASQLQSSCPAGNHTANVALGCYRDEKDSRLLGGYFASLKTSNSPSSCVELCLQSGYPYAGVQYSRECFCGFDAPPSSAKLPDSSCNMKCLGHAKEICGGFYAMNVYETGIAKFTAQLAASSAPPGEEQVRIAFLLTLNGRALRQVHRLLRALYAPQHVYYIHVDARQDYLYRKLLELEPKFPNIRLARKRFSTIWGGASLLTMLLQCMQDLLKSSWQWDFVINLSESDFPVKTLDKLVDFMSANRGRNFVKGHGRETQRFIQKQGLDKTFVECDTHMWRIGDRKLPAGIQVDGGSDWVALSRPFVSYVTHPAKEDTLLQELLRIFRHTLLPAESFFHTVLRNTQHCHSYVDNNLHVTNWKRKQGCKCQYKHVVDWCGCSPNDFKPEDWARLQATEQKSLFFARKFEPIINQAVLLQLEEWLYGPYTNDYANLHGYWQSLYHHEDVHSAGDDLTRTIGDSLMRLAVQQTKLKHQLQAEQLLELTHYLHRDQYKGFLVRFSAQRRNDSKQLQLETRVRPVQLGKLARNARFSKRLRNFEVSTDFDQKEQVARNFAKMLGPKSELVLSYTYQGVAETRDDAAHSYNLTLLWLDPLGRLQDFNELHVEESQLDVINHSKTLLKQPLTPGIWTAKLIGRSSIYAQLKFLVSPLAYSNGSPLETAAAAKTLNGGLTLSLPEDFELPVEWQQHLDNDNDVFALREEALANAQLTGQQLHARIDELVGKFFQLRETCEVNGETRVLPELPLCQDTAWSSLASDPKSDIEALLKRR